MFVIEVKLELFLVCWSISCKPDCFSDFIYFHLLGDQAVDEEGVHSGVFPGPKVDVGVLHACQAGLPEQDVCQSMNHLLPFSYLPIKKNTTNKTLIKKITF